MKQMPNDICKVIQFMDSHHIKKINKGSKTVINMFQHLDK